jgi:intracellular sulfur oxidation DsrE/DsrF family protein
MRVRAAALCLLVASALPALAGARSGIDVEVPVRLQTARVAFNTDRAILSGERPTVFVWLDEMLIHFEDWRTRRRLIVVLHGPAGEWALNDAAWNRLHDDGTGNPQAAEISRLQEQRVDFELCAYTMELNGWTNADLLPGVRVTTGAIARLIQLQQQGWTILQP